MNEPCRLLLAFVKARVMHRKISLRPRKEPQQERSRQMRDDILDAAVRFSSAKALYRVLTTSQIP
jgi:IS5 family transposase